MTENIYLFKLTDIVNAFYSCFRTQLLDKNQKSLTANDQPVCRRQKGAFFNKYFFTTSCVIMNQTCDLLTSDLISSPRTDLV